MNTKTLTILGLALVQSSIIGASYVPKDYKTSYSSYETDYHKTSLSWSYFWENLDLNPTFQKITLGEVDCSVAPNIINWVPNNIVFDDYLNFDFGYEHSESDSLIEQSNALRQRCPNLKLVIDPQLAWNNQFAEQVKMEQIPFIVESLVRFSKKYYIQGLVISFGEDVVLNDAKTYAFFKALTDAFKYNDLLLLGYFPHSSQYEYVRPLVFEFLDQLLIEVTDFNTKDELVINAPEIGERGYGTIIETFLKFGANAEKIVLSLPIFGVSFKRTCSDAALNYDVTKGQQESAGFGSFLFADHLLTDANKASETSNLHTQAQICRIEDDYEWKKAVDPIQHTPYAYTDSVWVSYDNNESLKTKIDIAKEYKIGGVFIDFINFDDFNGSCGGKTYPVTRYIDYLLNY